MSAIARGDLETMFAPCLWKEGAGAGAAWNPEERQREKTGTRIVAVTGLRGPGLYRVLLASRLPGQTGAYALRIVSEEPVRPLSPNGSAVRAELGAFSQQVEGFYRDRYRFSGAEGREHTITVRSSAFAPVVQLQGPGGAVRGETGRAGGVVTFVFTPSRSGTHTLVVSFIETLNRITSYCIGTI